jgi:4-hydroxy 2-oxovalerate aldolase
MVHVLDVTLREAGLANGFAFSCEQAVAIAATLDHAGVDVVEAGYRRPGSAGTTGASCPAAYLTALRAACCRSDLAVMVHLPEVGLDEYERLVDEGVDLVRFAVAPREVGMLAGHARAAVAAGLQFTVNITRATELAPEVVVDAARTAQDLGASCFYVADSNGSLYPDGVRALASRLRPATKLPLGFHAHDNLRLAFANALIALEAGFTWVDASLGGAGKGGGNLMLELVLGYLGVHGRRTVDVIALARTYADHVAPTMPPDADRRGCNTVFGLLDLNLDRIRELAEEAERRRVPMDNIVANEFLRRISVGEDDERSVAS